VRPVLRLAAYALLPATRPDGRTDVPTDEHTDDRVVLVEASRRSDLAGHWFLPGGGVDHGEHPDDAVVREVGEETGLQIRVLRVRQALTDVLDLPHRGVQVHTVRLVYAVEVTGGALRSEVDGSSEHLAVVTPAEAASLPLAPYVARALGLPAVDLRPLHPDVTALAPLSGVGGAAGPGVGGAAGLGTPPGRSAVDAGGADRTAAVPRLRVGVYGIALRGDGRQEELLLTRLADHVGGTGRWTLPGGGLDHGETVEDGLRRELYEETGLAVADAHLLGVSSSHFTGRAPDGVVEDFHGVRVVHRVRVGPGQPRVVEVGGSTAEARWVPVTALTDLPLGSLVRDSLALLGHPAARTISR